MIILSLLLKKLKISSSLESMLLLLMLDLVNIYMVVELMLLSSLWIERWLVCVIVL